MSIIDHLSVGVPDVPSAKSFYDPVMKTLACEPLAETAGFIAYGKSKIQFLVMVPENGEPSTAGNGTHISFMAPDSAAVDAFHRISMERGGICEGVPGPREAYPMPGVYAAYVRDPFGNKLEAIAGGFGQVNAS